MQITDLPSGVTAGGTVVPNYDFLGQLMNETTTPAGAATGLGKVAYTTTRRAGR